MDYPTSPNLRRACDEIDAAMFSADTFHADAERLTLRTWLTRWLRACDDLDRDAAFARLSKQEN